MYSKGQILDWQAGPRYFDWTLLWLSIFVPAIHTVLIWQHIWTYIYEKHYFEENFLSFQFQYVPTELTVSSIFQRHTWASIFNWKPSHPRKVNTKSTIVLDVWYTLYNLRRYEYTKSTIGLLRCIWWHSVCFCTWINWAPAWNGRELLWVLIAWVLIAGGRFSKTYCKAGRKEIRSHHHPYHFIFGHKFSCKQVASRPFWRRRSVTRLSNSLQRHNIL